MQTPLDRRQFLRQGLVLTGGALLLSDALPALGLDAPRAALPGWLASFADCSRQGTWLGVAAATAGGGKPGPAYRLRLEVTDLAGYADAASRLNRFGMTDVRSAGSRLAFVAEGRTFELEVLFGNDFQQAAAGQASQAVFAHDALARSVAGGTLTDTLRAQGELRLLRASAGPAALADVLRGRVEAAAAELKPDAAFAALERRTLAATVVDRPTAEATLRAFFSQLPALLQTESAEAWSALIAAPLLRTAFQTRLGTTPEAVARQVSAEAGAAGWCAIALADEIRAGRGPAWVGLGSVGEAMASLKAVQAARHLLA